MNLHVVVARTALVLSAIALTFGVWFGVWLVEDWWRSDDVLALVAFGIGCAAYSYLTLFVVQHKRGVISRAFLGSFYAMLVVLIIHVIFFTLTLLLRGDWFLGWQFLLTLFGIIPAMIVGAFLGWIIDLHSKPLEASGTVNNILPIILKKIIVWGLLVGMLSIPAGLFEAIRYDDHLSRTFADLFFTVTLNLVWPLIAIGALVGFFLGVRAAKKSSQNSLGQNV